MAVDKHLAGHHDAVEPKQHSPAGRQFREIKIPFECRPTHRKVSRRHDDLLPSLAVNGKRPLTVEADVTIPSGLVRSSHQESGEESQHRHGRRKSSFAK